MRHVVEETELERADPGSLSQDVCELETDQEQYAGNWIWRAVAHLTTLEDFDPSPRWVANRLGISLEEAVAAIDGLLTLRIIERTPRGYSLIKPNIRFGQSTIPIDTLIRGHLQVSGQILSRFTPKDTYRTGVVCATEAQIVEYIRALDRAAMDLVEAASKPSLGEARDVYATTITSVKLTHSQIQDKQQSPSNAVSSTELE